MTLADLGSLGEFISSIAVVLSLMYVAFQLRQNTIQQRRNEANIGQNQFSEFRFMLMSDTEFAKTWDKGLNDPGALDKIETIKFDSGMNQVSWTIFHMWDRSNSGMASKGDWERMESVIQGLHESPGALRWWEENSALFSSEYQTEISRILSKG